MKKNMGQQQSGFSVIELVVVIAIVAIIASGVGLVSQSVASPQQQLHKAGLKLFAQMQFARDEALMQRRLLGLKIQASPESSATYSWHKYDNQQWLTLEEPLLSTELDEALTLAVSVDDSLLQILQEEELNSEARSDTIPPAVIFYPNSNISNFEITLALKDNKQESFAIFLDNKGSLVHSLMDKES